MRIKVAMLILVMGTIFSNVLVTIKPLYLIAKNLTDHPIDVLIDPNTNPHMFQLKPSDMVKIRKSDVFIALGYGFEEWISKLKGENLCVVTNGLERTMDENSHVWLDPVMVTFLAIEMSQCLERAYPEERERIEGKLLEFLKKLVIKSSEIQESFSKYSDVVVLELRPALYHFVRRFLDAEYVTLVGKTQPNLTPRKLKEAIGLCKRRDLHAMILEKSSSERIAEPILRSCRMKKIVVDVLGSDFEDFFDFLDSISKSVLEAIE